MGKYLIYLGNGGLDVGEVRDSVGEDFGWGVLVVQEGEFLCWVQGFISLVMQYSFGVLGSVERMGVILGSQIY